MGNNESTIKESLKGKPMVVIVGGGYAGARVAKDLDSYCNVILIDRKDHFFHNLGALRASVEPSFTSQILIPYNKLLKYGHVLQAEVTEISPSGVKIHGREELINYDYLVITTGTSYAFPMKVGFSEAKQVYSSYEELSLKIKEAKNILIIGGGPVGIELYGEINDIHPNKNITLVQSNQDILAGEFSQELRERVKTQMKEINPKFNLILGEKVIINTEEVSNSEKKYMVGEFNVETDKGTKIAADLIFFCGGAKVNKSSYNKPFADKVDENGRLKVNKYFQVEGYETIFSIGDCSNVPDTKTSYAAGVQAQFLAKNLLQLMNDQQMNEYTPISPNAMLVPIGRKTGTSQLPFGSGILVGPFLTSLFKGSNLLAPKYWAELNQNFSDNESGSIEYKKYESKINDETNNLSNLLSLSEEEAKKLAQGYKVPSFEGVRDHT